MTSSSSSLIFTFSALYCSYSGQNFWASASVNGIFAAMICFCADRRSFLSNWISWSDAVGVAGPCCANAQLRKTVPNTKAATIVLIIIFFSLVWREPALHSKGNGYTNGDTTVSPPCVRLVVATGQLPLAESTGRVKSELRSG